MSQAKAPGANTEIVRRHRAEIQAWQREGLSGREIAKRLGLSETSYRRAMQHINATATPINSTALAKVYEGKPVHASEEAPTWLAEMTTHLPALRRLEEILPVLDAMAKQWSEQQTLTQIPDEYQKYNAIYTVRLNDQLIEAIKTYAKQHRLTQSELITIAVQRLLSGE